MPFPVRPSDFEQTIVLADDSVGTAIVKTFIRMPILFFRMIAYMFTANGSLSDAFKEQICNLSCAGDDSAEEEAEV